MNFGRILCEAARAGHRLAAHGPPSETGETGDTAEKRAGDVNSMSMIRYL
jgi:hypothetical protein